MKPRDENIITNLHKQLRQRLYETGLQAQAIYPGNQDQVNEFLDGLTELVGFSALVAMEEERSLFPGIITVAPFMIPLLEQEHEKISEVGEKICVLADEFEDAYAETERSKNLSLIHTAFNEWLAQMMQHLCREEMIMNQVWASEIETVKVLSMIAA
jgi:hypothetical protein